MTAEFQLDKTENPHPKMLERALKLRARTLGIHSPSDRHMWHGYLMAMADATGETTDAIEDWMDRQEARQGLERTAKRREGPSTLQKSPAKAAGQRKRWGT